MIPSAVAFVLLGDVVIAAIYRTGHFQRADVLFVWAVLAGSAVGLLASTSGRLYSSAFYALRDTRTPLKFAVIRVSLTLALGYLCALPLPRMLGISQRWGAAGLTLSAGVAGWLEFLLLRRALHRHIGAVPSGRSRIARLWTVAILAAIAMLRDQSRASGPELDPDRRAGAAALLRNLSRAHAMDGNREHGRIQPVLHSAAIDFQSVFTIQRPVAR